MVANAIYSVGETTSTIDCIVSYMRDDHMMTEQIGDKRIFPVAQEAAVDAKIATLNAAIATIDAGGV